MKNTTKPENTNHYCYAVIKKVKFLAASTRIRSLILTLKISKMIYWAAHIPIRPMASSKSTYQFTN